MDIKIFNYCMDVLYRYCMDGFVKTEIDVYFDNNCTLNAHFDYCTHSFQPIFTKLTENTENNNQTLR